jgi:hypothetical protein
MLTHKLLQATSASKIQLTRARVDSVSIGSGVTSISLPFSSTVSAGDVVIIAAAIMNDTVDRVLDITGYTQITERWVFDTYTINFIVAYKVLTADETSATFTRDAGGLETVVYYVLALSGVDTSNPIDAQVSTQGLNTANANPPAVTPVTQGAWIAVFAAGSSPNTSPFNDPSYLRSFLTKNSINAGNLCGGYVRDTTGTYDPGVISFGGTDSTSFCWTAATIAIKPAP